MPENNQDEYGIAQLYVLELHHNYHVALKR
jgi:hypothetical protein